VIVSVEDPNVSVDVLTLFPVCDAVSVFGLELDAPAAIVTMPEFWPLSVIVEAWLEL
jgi:hypothetical protein